MKTKLILISTLVVVVIAGFVFYLVATKEIPNDEEAIACTMDAKLCPDGSYVGRVAPDCEFAECPGFTREAREVMVSNYIEQNISELSPEPEVLGGTFYVTSIEFTSENSGVVEYEDGHIALIADFEYSVNSNDGTIEVIFMDVREA